MAKKAGKRFGSGLFQRLRAKYAGGRTSLGGAQQEYAGQLSSAHRRIVGKRSGAAMLLLLSACLTAACADSSSEESRPFPAKDTSWHILDFGTDYMELDHGWLVRRVSALTFVPFPPDWNAAGSTESRGNGTMPVKAAENYRQN